jgi:prolyl oligopeptidase
LQNGLDTSGAGTTRHASVNSGRRPFGTGRPNAYPPSPKGDHRIRRFGLDVPDPYRWLDDWGSPRTRKWVAAQNQLTSDELAPTIARHGIRARLTELCDYDLIGLPRRVGNSYFALKRTGLTNHPILYRQRTPFNGGEILIDPNQISPEGFVRLTSWSVSPNGRYLAYSIDTKGRDIEQIRLLDLSSGNVLPEVIDGCRFPRIVWSPDSAGFYYNQLEPQVWWLDGRERVLYHLIGTGHEADTVTVEDDDPWVVLRPLATTAGGWFVFERNAYVSADIHALRLLDDVAPVNLTNGSPGHQVFVGVRGDTVIVKTDVDAPLGRVVAIELERPEKDHWLQLVSEGSDVLHRAVYAGETLVTLHAHHVTHVVSVWKDDGTARCRVHLQLASNVSDIAVVDGEIYLQIQSFLEPPTIYHLEADGSLEACFRPAHAFESQKYGVEQIFYSSKDGTRIPMFIVAKRDAPRDGNQPLLLYSYGGGREINTAVFHPSRLLWLELGGVFALANVRGGLEYGEPWYQAQRQENKQKVFDDVIAAVEWLIERKYTSRRGVAIDGASNGGLTVAGCYVQRPDLFGAVSCRVAVVEMLVSMLKTHWLSWNFDAYGFASDKAQQGFLRRLSPLYNLRAEGEYPPILITAGENDIRCNPIWISKFAATIQNETAAGNLALLRCLLGAGHGPNDSTALYIDQWQDVIAFLWRACGELAGRSSATSGRRS